VFGKYVQLELDVISC